MPLMLTQVHAGGCRCPLCASGVDEPCQCVRLYPAQAPCSRFGDADITLPSISIVEETIVGCIVFQSRSKITRCGKRPNSPVCHSNFWCVGRFVMKIGRWSARSQAWGDQFVESSACAATAQETVIRPAPCRRGSWARANDVGLTSSRGALRASPRRGMALARSARRGWHHVDHEANPPGSILSSAQERKRVSCALFTASWQKPTALISAYRKASGAFSPEPTL